MTSILALTACSDADNTPAKTASAAQSSPPTLQEKADLSPFAGFASARFGSDEAAVRAAWKGSLREARGISDTCRQLVQDPRPEKGFGTSFMLENGLFVRYDIDTRERKAPRGLQVGSSAQQIRSTYPGQFEEQPHKYVEGARTFIVKPFADNEARLVFETDANGLVTRWRIGMPPAVFYVEGCS
ncbi:lectin [Phytopseudomonas flavescens]|nr:lectin [Pseudomonas flavescens]